MNELQLRSLSSVTWPTAAAAGLFFSASVLLFPQNVLHQVITRRFSSASLTFPLPGCKPSRAFRAVSLSVRPRSSSSPSTIRSSFHAWPPAVPSAFRALQQSPPSPASVHVPYPLQSVPLASHPLLPSGLSANPPSSAFPVRQPRLDNPHHFITAVVAVVLMYVRVGTFDYIVNAFPFPTRL